MPELKIAKLDWIRGNKRHVSADGSGYRYAASVEIDGAEVSAEIVTASFGSPGRYRLTLSINGAELPTTRHERLKWAQEAALEHCEEIAGLEDGLDEGSEGRR